MGLKYSKSPPELSTRLRQAVCPARPVERWRRRTAAGGSRLRPARPRCKMPIHPRSRAGHLGRAIPFSTRDDEGVSPRGFIPLNATTASVLAPAKPGQVVNAMCRLSGIGERVEVERSQTGTLAEKDCDGVAEHPAEHA